MRINHNIAALNTYRQLGIGSDNSSKSMEKLSSGLRINKAGDDAAGLAISEKMRAQIRGLTQASRNSQDGISLVQTAEGALQETQAILQRMRELAVQSANSTNAENDRTEIQNEMNQLTSEINRIGNTTEFNTQKLLNVGGPQAAEITTTTAGSGAGTVVTDTFVQNTGSTAAVAAKWDSGAWTALGNTQDGTFVFNGVTVTVDADDAAAAGDQTTVGAVTATSATITLDSQAGDGADTATEQVAHILDALAQIKAAGGAGSALADFTFAEDTATGGITITGTAADGATNNALEITSGGAGGIANVGAANQQGNGDGVVGVTEILGDYQFDISTAFSAGDTIDIGGQTFTAVASGANTAAGEFNIGNDTTDQATNLATAINANAALGARFTATGSTDTVQLVEKAGQATGTDLTDPTEVQATASQGEYSFSLSQQPQDGGSIEIDGQEITYTTDGAANAAGIAAGTHVLIGADLTATAANLRTAIDNNAVLSAAYAPAAGTGTTITLTQELGQESATAPTVTERAAAGDSSFTAKLQIGANEGQSFEIKINDMRGRALGIAGTANQTITSDDGTATASFTTANGVSNGTSSSVVECGLDVSTHDKATASVKILDDAINTVSSERSKLGSYQNRLEHTIKNLNASSENMQAAESRVRDVDMAKEMMEFTKNNILTQAAQAMLAQANQAPQGVLQLLR